MRARRETLKRFIKNQYLRVHGVELINKCFNPNLKILGHQKTQDVNVGDVVVSSTGVR